MKRIILLITCLSLLLLNCSSNSFVRDDFKKHFQKFNVTGSFVLYDLNKNQYTRYNSPRCDKGFLPASTFKIFNSLVALETGVVKDEQFLLKWDGKKRFVSIWNQDHDLKSALKNSVIWYYQEVARRVGKDKMLNHLQTANYGNGDISAGIDVFWLQGGFQISQNQQIEFLKRLYQQDLPFSKRTMDIVKKLLLVEETSNYKIYAKTGTVARVKPNLGWWVGFIEKDDNVYFFATNIQGDIKKKSFWKARIDITKNILKDLKIIR